MTTQALVEFGNALNSNPEMASGLSAALAGKHGSEGAEAFAAYASSQGFEVTRADAETLQQAVRSQEGALSDAQLDGVAGGAWNLDWMRPFLGASGDMINGVGNAMKHLAGN